MFPILISPDITTFVGTQRSGEFFEGVVHVLRGPSSFRQQLVYVGVRDTKVVALRDAERDAACLIQLCRNKATIPDDART